MVTFDVRLIDAAYSVFPKKSPRGKDRDDVTVKLFGKTRDNKSITILCPDFKPYFNLFDPPASLKERLASLNEVIGTEDIVLEYKGKNESFTRVYVSEPWKVPKLRGEYDTKPYDVTMHIITPPVELKESLEAEPEVVEVAEKDGYLKITTTDRAYTQKLISKYDLLKHMEPNELERFHNKAAFFSADIIFTNRFIYDMDLDTCIRVEGEPIENHTEYTTDIVLKATAFDKCDIFNPKLKILSFDIETSIKFNNIYCICMSMYDEETGEWTNRRIESEFMVRHDNPTPEEKAAWEADEKHMLLQFVNFIRRLDPDIVTGYNIDNFDLQKIFERATMYFGKLDQRSENIRSNLDILNFGRDGLGLSRREKQGDKANARTVTWGVNGRVIIDAWKGVKKELKLKRETLGFVSQHLFNDTKDNINSTKIDAEWMARKKEVVEYCLKDAQLALRILTHPKINSVNKLMDVAIPSRLPIKEVSGGQNRMIESILIRMADREKVAVPVSSNVEYSYKGGFVYPTKPGLWERVIGLDFSSMYPSQMIKHNICFTTYTQNRNIPGVQISPKFDENSDVTAAFVPKEVRNGIIPRMVSGFLDSRKEAKKKMKDAKAAGDKDAEDYYNRLQAAIKVMANATYGYFGTKFCRWYNNQYIAPSITAWAREEINTVVDTLEKDGCTVVAGDTDSVMFFNPICKTVDESKEYGFKVQKQFSQGGMHLELEKVMERFFGGIKTDKKKDDEEKGAKKRYFGSIVWPEKDTIIRGYATRRTDSFDLESETMLKMMELILEGKPEEAVALAKKTVKRVLKGNVEIAELVKSKGVKDFDEYKNPNSQAGVQAVRKMMEQGFEFTPGMKHSWIVVNSRVTPQKVEPVIEGVPFEHKPDYRYYAEKLATSLGRITIVFGVDDKKLMEGDSQKGLFSFDEEKEGKQPSLSDFM